MEDFNLVIGIHSIICAIKNPDRSLYKLVGTEDGIVEVKKQVKLDDIKVEMYSSHKVQEEAKKYFKDLGLEYHRVPSGVFLVCSELETLEVMDMYRAIEADNNKKIICLDQVTDVHNAAAILRTASFYGVDFVVVPDKKSFGLTPSFFRIASGAAEYVKLVSCSKLTRTIKKLQELNVNCVALSEHASGKIESILGEQQGSLCLVFGREDVGIGNAVLRLIENRIALESMGDIKSLNVSIAAAVTMEKCFSK